MLHWSDKFATHIEIVDEQHKRIFELIAQFAKSYEQHGPNQQQVHAALKELADYAVTHFNEEEGLMQVHKVDPRHISMHRMEHKSFIYDVSALAEQMSVGSEEQAQIVSEKLVRFTTAWLAFHIMGMDQSMAAQLLSIEKGANPTQAYEQFRVVKLDSSTARTLIDAVYEMWREARQHSRQLEDEMQQLRQQSQRLQQQIIELQQRPA